MTEATTYSLMDRIVNAEMHEHLCHPHERDNLRLSNQLLSWFVRRIGYMPA